MSARDHDYQKKVAEEIGTGLELHHATEPQKPADRRADIPEQVSVPVS
jgi:hypothetical protein